MGDHSDIDHSGLTGVPAAGIAATILDAKGDIIAASAADTAARLAVGANGSVLRAASGQSTGLEWQKNNYTATAAPAVGDDDGDGYSVGSVWIDVTGDDAYICVDASTGAAVWLPFDSSSGESWEGAWSAGTYTDGQIVEHNDVIYQVNTTSTSDEPPGTDWDVLYTAPGGGGGDTNYIDLVAAETNLLQYWPLNEASGTSYADVLGGTAMVDKGTVSPGKPGPMLQGDVDGSCLAMNGANTRIGRSAITWPATFTYEAWIFLTSIVGGGCVLGQWNGAGSMLFINSATEVRAYSGGSFATWTSTAAELLGWHHVLVGHDGTNIKLFWDGVQKATSAQTKPGTNVGGDFLVGAYNASQPGQIMAVSDVAIFSDYDAGRGLAHYNLGRP